jgi:lipopolysaccharide cholinephosphotransferase
LEKDLEANWDFNQGIFIDIFPLDRVPEDKGKRERFLYELQLIKLELFFLKNRSWKFANIPLERERMNYLKNLYEKNRKRYNNTQENCWATLAFPEHNNIIKNIDFYKNQYPDVFLTFEGRDLRVPNIYHGVLEDIYGEDYLTPKKYSGLHGRILVNTHKTYKNNMEDFQILK